MSFRGGDRAFCRTGGDPTLNPSTGTFARVNSVPPRMEGLTYNWNIGKFYEPEWSPNGSQVTGAVVHSSVTNWMEKIREDARCPERSPLRRLRASAYRPSGGPKTGVRCRSSPS